MANKRVNTYTKKRVSPLQRQATKMRRPKIDFDGSTVSCTTYTGVPNTVAGITKQAVTVDCSAANFGVAGAATAGAAHALATGVLGLYSQYRYNSLSVEFVPTIGPASPDAGGRIYIAYIDNPEKMMTWRDSTTGILNFVRGCRNVRNFNLWERFTYRVPLTWRRKMFDTNTTFPATADEFERSTQGMIIMAVESTSAAIVGTVKVDSSIRLHQLNITLNA